MAYKINYPSLSTITDDKTIGYSGVQSGNFGTSGDNFNTAVSVRLTNIPSVGVWLVIGSCNFVNGAGSGAPRVSLSTTAAIDTTFTNSYVQNGNAGNGPTLQVSRVFSITSTGASVQAFFLFQNGGGNQAGNNPSYYIQFTRIA